MESITIKLSDEQLASSVNIENLLADIFQPGNDNYHKLTYELQREFKWGGSPDVKRVAFDRVKYDNASGKGSFRITLDISFTFGCEDVTSDKADQTSEWTLAINKAGKVMTLYSSPFAESRSTADEF